MYSVYALSRRIWYLNNLGYSFDFIWTRVYCTVIYILKCYFRIICCWKCEMYKLKSSGDISEPREVRYTNICFYLFYIRGDIICMNYKTIRYEEMRDLIKFKISFWVSSIFNFYEILTYVQTQSKARIMSMYRLLHDDVLSKRHFYYVQLTME